jgi:hypothetical protein
MDGLLLFAPVGRMAEGGRGNGLALEVAGRPVEAEPGIAFGGAFVEDLDLVPTLAKALGFAFRSGRKIALGLENGRPGDEDLDRPVPGGAEAAVGAEIDADKAVENGLEGSRGTNPEGGVPSGT